MGTYTETQTSAPLNDLLRNAPGKPLEEPQWELSDTCIGTVTLYVRIEPLWILQKALQGPCRNPCKYPTPYTLIQPSKNPYHKKTTMLIEYPYIRTLVIFNPKP